MEIGLAEIDTLFFAFFDVLGAFGGVFHTKNPPKLPCGQIEDNHTLLFGLASAGGVLL